MSSSLQQILIVLLLLLNALFGLACIVVMRSKNRSSLSGFIMGLLFGFIGLLICNALPFRYVHFDDEASAYTTTAKPPEDWAVPVADMHVTCPHCYATIPATSSVCPYCGDSLSGMDNLELTCQHCSKVLPPQASVCPYCGRSVMLG
jgi:RNA polymerase subunit RPABC4/transcription elongation factor Spt4